MFEELLKAAVGTVILPVAAVVDIVTLPAIANQDRESSTACIAESIITNLEKATSESKDKK